MHRARDLVSHGVILLVLGALAGFAWLTWNPEAPILERAEGWPLVGELARSFRVAYGVAPETPALAVRGEASATPPATPDDAAPEAPAGLLWLPAGVPIHRHPEAGDEPLARTLARVAAVVLDDRGEALRVRAGPLEGWVRQEELVARLPGGGERGPRPPLPLPAQRGDQALLERALAHLPPTARRGRLGAYDLVTGVEDGALPARLARRLDGLERLYAERYGLRPLGGPAETIVLFDDEVAYRGYAAGVPGVAGLDSAAHTASGVVALYRGARRPEEVGASLVHEIAHLLNRRAIGPALPPWLDEGIAAELAFSDTDATGRLLPGSLGGRFARAEREVHTVGGRAALIGVLFAHAEDRLTPLGELLEMEREAFVERGAPAYAQSAFFVRFLLDPATPRRAAAFRSYLAGIAAGGPATPEALLVALGTDAARLDAEMGRWLAERRRQLEAELGQVLSVEDPEELEWLRLPSPPS